MKFKLLLFLLLWSGMAHAANLYTFNGGGTVGNWSVSSTWTTDATGSTQVNAAVPGTNDVVTILNGYTVSLTANIATTGLQVTIQQGGVLDMSTFTMATLISLNGQGTLRLKSASFPGITTNNFANAGAGTVEYYDLPTNTALPTSVTQYNNLRVLNSTATAIVVTLGSTLTVQGSLTLLRTGGTVQLLTLNMTGTSPLTIVGDLSVGAGTTLGLSGGGAHTVTLSGNEVVAAQGTLDFITNGTANITFTGAADRTLTNSGTTKLNSLTVDKGVGQQFVQSIVSASGATLTVNTSLNNVVTLTNGTLRLGSNITLPTLINNTNGNNGYVIPASAGLWIDGATVSLPSNVNGGLISQGLFRISAGSFTSQGNDGTVIGDAGSYVIEGGTVTTEKFSTVKAGTPLGSFAMMGGTFNARGTGANLNNQKAFARFSLPYVTQIYNVSGGIINVYNAESSGSGGNSGVEIAAGTGNYSVTGGDFNIILPGTAGPSDVVFNLASTAPFWNLTITKPSAGTATTVVSLAATANVTAQPLVVLKDLTLSGANTPTLQANGKDVTVQGNFTVGSAAVYNPGLNTTSFTGGRNHFFIVDGSVTDGTTANAGVYNLVIDKPAGSLSLAGTASSFPRVRNQLRILSGVMDDGGKELKVLGNVLNSATHTSSGGAGSVTLAGTALQTLDGDGNGVFGNLYFDNSTLAPGSVAVQMLAAQAVSDKLLFKQNHILDIGTNRLSITSISTTAVATSGGTVVFSNQCLIRTAGNQSDGGLRKTFGSFSASNAAAFLYPVGSVVSGATVYTPASIGITAQPSRYGKITVAPVSVQNPFVTNTALALRYYWAVSSIDFVGLPASKITHRYSAPKSLVAAGSTLTNYVPAYYVPTKWTIVGNAANVDELGASTSFDTNFTNVDIDGQYTAGEPVAFGVITAYYSRVAAGNWETPATWSTDAALKYAGAASTTIPGPSNPVFIGDGATYNHVVTVTTNGAKSGSLEIASGSTLDVGVLTGHNFGSLPNAKVQGAGRLRISSNTATAVFPGGDFGNFLGPQGGTVEYYTQPTGSFTLPAGAAQATYRALELNPASGQTITLPALNLHIYENLSGGTITGGTGISNLSNVAAGNLTIDGSLRQLRGTLRYNTGARSIIVAGNVEVSTGATVGVNGTGTYALEIGGGVLNNGIFNMSGVAVTFVGATNQAVTGTTTGASTTFTSLTIDKGSSQVPVLTLDVAGTLSVPANNWLVGLNGTFRYAKPNFPISLSTADYSVVSTAALEVDGVGSVLNATTGGTLLLAGRAYARTGTLNVGTPGSTGINSIEYSGATDPVITVDANGTLNVTGQIRRPTTTTQGNLRYEQFGGAATIYGNGSSGSTRAQFEVLNPGSYFGMSGGTLNLRRSNNNSGIISDLYLHPESSSVTGGTIVLGDATANQGALNLTVDTTIPLYNLTVESGSGTTTNTAKLLQNPLTLRGNLTIGNSSSVFDANSLDVSVAGNFINNNATANASGLLTVGGYQVQSLTQTTTLNGTATDQQVSGTAGNLTTFANLVVNNTRSGGVVQLQANTPIRVNNVLTLQAGELADNGQTITAKGNVVNSARHSGAGSFVLDGGTGQTVDGNGAGRFGNLTLNNSTGATLLNGQQVDGTLTFNAASSSLNIGSNLLRLANTAATAVSGASAARFIQTNGIVADAGVEKAYANAATGFVFPVGSGGKYTPATLNVTNTGGALGTITVRPINAKHPATTSALDTELKYYWQVSHTGFGASPLVTHIYQYIVTDVQGTEGSYVTGRFQGNAWTMPAGSTTPGGVNTTAHTLTITAAGFIDGDYTAGYPAEFGTVRVYYSRTSAQTAGGADWDTAASWTYNADGSDVPTGQTPPTGPTAANPVVILVGHLINTNNSGRGAAALTLNGTLNLGDKTSNNFSTVTGAGRLIIGSAVFPAGNYSAFTATTGGTVEYTGSTAFTLTARTTYHHLEFSGTGTKTLSNVNLSINGKVVVAAGATVRNPSNVALTLTSPSEDFTNQGTFDLGNGSLQIGHSLGNSGALTLGTGSLSTVSSLTNSGMLTAGAGSVLVGIALTNTSAGTYNAGSGSLQTQNDLTNNGIFNANQGTITIGTSLLTTGTFLAGNGNITVTQNLTNSGTYTANTNLLTINGDFTNSSNFSAGSGRITLQGNWTNSNVFTTGTSTVNFISNSARTLGGSAATTFYTVNKTGSGALTLNKDATVADVLTLSSGNLVTGTNILRLTNTLTQPIVGQGSTAFVAGKLAISFPNDINASRIFPVGNGQSYRPVTISQNAASASAVVLVEMINLKPTGTLDASLSNLSQLRYYAVSTLSGTINQPTVRLSFNTNGAPDEKVNVPGNLRIARASSATGPWTNAGGAGVFTPAAPAGNAVSAITTIDSGSFFALASTNQIDNPLPVELVSFTATLVGPAVQVAWTTASEKNSDYFEVQRSGNGLSFEVSARVNAQGTSNRLVRYGQRDVRPLAGTSYYRLRLVDRDGSFVYGPVAVVQFGTAAVAAVVLYPNPSKGDSFQLSGQGIPAGIATVRIFDLQGRLVGTHTVDFTQTAEATVNPARLLTSGMYLVQIETLVGRFTQRLVVE